MPTRALLIDAMGTLVSLRDPVPLLVAGLRDRCGVVVDAERARGALRAEITFYRRHMQDGRDAASVAELHRACAVVLRDALELEDEIELGVMTEVLLGALRFQAFADAAPALARARDAGARVIVVSNWDASLPDVLDRVGLRGLVDGVVSSGAVGARKPDPAIFARALTLAGAPAADCVHVGDSLAEDVAGAWAAGIRAVLLRRGGDGGGAPVPPGVRVIPSLDLISFAG